MFSHSVWMGIGHIGALASDWVGPKRLRFPEAIDRLLFLLALALAGGSFRDLLKTATGFTLGQAVTLTLAFFGVVHLPEHWVEAAIALSIAYMAAEDLLREEFRHRWQIAAGFGLLQGFTFAGALQALHPLRREAFQALAGFSVGIQIGQCLILTTLVPIVNALNQEPVLKKYGVGTCAFLVYVTGSYWFFKRAFA